MMKFNSNVTHHVAVLAFPFGTHAGPLLSLVMRIAAEAPQVMFSFFNTSRSNSSLFSGENHEEHHNIKSYNVHDGIPEGFVPSGNPIEFINLFINATPGNYWRAMDQVVAETGKNFTCLITDAFLWFGADIAEEIHAKWVPLWTSGPHSVLAHLATDLIRERIPPSNVGDQNLSFLPGLSAVNASDLPEGVLDDKEAEKPLATMLHQMGQKLPRATVVAINSIVSVDPIVENELKSKVQLLLNVAPFTFKASSPTISDEQGCLQWLNQQKNASVVYISFGSMISPPPHELTALAEALEECKFPFIWVSGNQEKQLPNGFVERTRTIGKVVSWAPQMEILKHAAIGVFVTHCGWNSIVECIVGGVPMICRPFFGDQKLNARVLEKVWGIGVTLEKGIITKQSALKNLELILSSEEGRVMRQKVEELRKIATEAVEPNGSSTKNFRTMVQIVTT